MKALETNGEEALALSALVWTLSDAGRADRLLSLTGLTPDDLRAGTHDRGMLAAVIAFLEGHEPDLILCARILEITPLDLVEARRRLEA